MSQMPAAPTVVMANDSSIAVAMSLTHSQIDIVLPSSAYCRTTFCISKMTLIGLNLHDDTRFTAAVNGVRAMFGSVRPELLAEIEYRAKSGKVRHPFFKGMREDLEDLLTVR
jgi:hypothetical protein